MKKNQNAYIFPWNYRKSSIKHPRAAYLFQTHLGWGLFNLAKTMVLALHKGLEYRVKAQVQKIGGHAAQNQKHSKLPVGE